MPTRRKISDEVKESAAAEANEGPADFIFVPTGSTLLNLALSDNPFGGYQTGTVNNGVGDSSAGKSFLAKTALAEICYLPEFDEYELVYDDVEHRDNFDMRKLFGDKAADRVQPPWGFDDEGMPINSELVEDFQDAVYSRLEGNRPFIYVLDSMDALDSLDDIKKFEELMAARQKKRKEGKANKVPGTYGMGKAKSNSEILRRIKGKIRRTRSMVLIVSQTRDQVGVGFAEKTRSGGRALKFYSTHEYWMAVVSQIMKGDPGIKVGINTRVKVKKNSLTGKEREVEFPIFYDYGVDDITSMIDFMLAQKSWVNVKASVDTKGFAPKVMSRAKLIEFIESDPSILRKLRKLVGRAWNKREDGLKLNRKQRFE